MIKTKVAFLEGRLLSS